MICQLIKLKNQNQMDPTTAVVPGTTLPSDQEILKAIEEPTIGFFSNMASVFNKVKVGAEWAYSIVSTANIVYERHPYLVMGLSLYAGYSLIRKLIYKPLKHIIKFLYVRSKPLDKLLITYGSGLVVINGATKGLGPSYCFKLAEAGYRNFLLIDEN